MKIEGVRLVFFGRGSDGSAHLKVDNMSSLQTGWSVKRPGNMAANVRHCNYVDVCLKKTSLADIWYEEFISALLFEYRLCNMYMYIKWSWIWHHIG